MKFLAKLCPRCPDGTMRVQHGRRGYFYQCRNPDCRHTINETPAREEPVDPELCPIISLPFRPVAG